MDSACTMFGNVDGPPLPRERLGVNANCGPTIARAPVSAMEQYRDHSAVIPACSMTLRHFAMSRSIRAPSTSGGPPAVTSPCLANVPFTSGEARNWLTAALVRATASAGVPAGASMPNQRSTSKPVTPCSASVGTSGAAATRSALAIPRMRICLSAASGSATCVGTNMALTWLPTRSDITPDVPLYGICARSVPVGIECMLVEQGDGTIAHPRANAENARTMEFFRRLGIADKVREAGTPEDYPHTVLYLTALTGFEIARIERPGHGGRAPSTVSPERPQRCNQLWLDPILRQRAMSFPSVTVRLNCRFETFEHDDAGVIATVHDLATNERQRISADYLVACCGGASSIPKSLGIEMHGTPALEYNLNIFFRTPELWSNHDKGKAALHFFVDPQGIWRTLVQLDGRELWRLSLNGKEYFDNAETVDASAFIAGVVGKPVPHQVVSALRWVARDLVADKYQGGRVFLAGDAAHQNTPSGGF